MASYRLGVDIGTTFTAAAVQREERVEIAYLGDRAPSIPSVVFLREEGDFLVGDAANRRALQEPNRVAREFKRRIGDTTPLILAGTPCSPELLTARLLRWVVAKVAEVEGGEAERVALTHPASWNAYKLDVFRKACDQAEIDAPVTFLDEPRAAAIYYSSLSRVDAGSTLAVYDLGGGTFDIAIVRKTSSGFELLGDPDGLSQIGGLDVDAAVWNHVGSALGGALGTLDPDDPRAAAGVAKLRQDCIEAKEALSVDNVAVISVTLPSIQHDVRINRVELEQMIAPLIGDTIEAVRRALRSVPIEPEDLHSVLLVGGSSRIPLVAQLVSSALGRPVSVDAHPKHAIALGAAIAAGEGVRSPSEPAITPVIAAFEAPVTASVPIVVPPSSTPPPVPPPVVVPTIPQRAPARPPTRGRGVLVGLLAVIVLVAIALAFLVTRDDSTTTTSATGSSSSGGSSPASSAPPSRPPAVLVPDELFEKSPQEATARLTARGFIVAGTATLCSDSVADGLVRTVRRSAPPGVEGPNLIDYNSRRTAVIVTTEGESVLPGEQLTLWVSTGKQC